MRGARASPCLLSRSASASRSSAISCSGRQAPACRPRATSSIARLASLPSEVPGSTEWPTYAAVGPRRRASPSTGILRTVCRNSPGKLSEYGRRLSSTAMPSPTRASSQSSWRARPDPSRCSMTISCSAGSASIRRVLRRTSWALPRTSIRSKLPVRRSDRSLKNGRRRSHSRSRATNAEQIASRQNSKRRCDGTAIVLKRVVDSAGKGCMAIAVGCQAKSVLP